MISNSQNSSLLCTHIEEDINDIEAAFVEFEDTMRRDSAIQQHISNLSNKVLEGDNSFQKSWQYVMPKFTKLNEFCGGLATIFPGTTTVESNLSVLLSERDYNHQNHTDVALEGFL